MLIALSMAMAPSLSNAAPPTCEQARASCEHVLDLAVIAVDAQADVIASMSRQIDALKLANEAARPAVEAYGAWYNSPWLWMGVGFVGGAVAHRELSRP